MVQKALLCMTLLGAALSVIAAPTPLPQAGVDRSVLLQNAQEAQKLNDAFRLLTKDDPCQSELSTVCGEF
jgi:hypothetical protein